MDGSRLAPLAGRTGTHFVADSRPAEVAPVPETGSEILRSLAPSVFVVNLPFSIEAVSTCPEPAGRASPCSRQRRLVIRAECQDRDDRPRRR
jgi:hypothetical protein